jgi:fructosamine-3-kinase
MADPDRAAIARVLSAALGAAVAIASRRALAGGDINRVERLETSAGPFILKTRDDAPAGFFRAEADGLRALRAGTTMLRVPSVVACGDEPLAFLILEDLGDGSRTRDFDETLGRGLAELHQTRAPRFGFDADNFCGLTPQPNAWSSGWVDFYAEHRLGYQTDRAANAGLLSPSDRHHADALVARLDRLLVEPAEGPALVHGDLWSGNQHTTAEGTPALIDPAAYFASREAEFGMTTLFGDWSPRAYGAYAESFPLAPDWRDRTPLYQLYHLLNHLNLFGGGYHGQVMAIINRYV